MSALLEHLKGLVEEAALGLPDVTSKTAFGSFGFFVDDRMFALAFRKEGRIGVKLPDPAVYQELMAVAGAGPWAPHKSAMTAWVLVPESWNDDLEALRPWVRRAHALVGAQPPKAAKTQAPRKKTAPKKPAAAKKAPTKAPRAKKATAKTQGTRAKKR